MKWNKLYEYPASMRTSIEGKRHYEITGKKLPSVTTILSETKSQEAIDSINRWKARVGEDQATRVKDQAASRGTNMHYHLEKYILGEGHKDLTDEGQVAGDMAQVIIDKGLGDLSEIWGSEVTLYYPGLYAGATDLVGVYDYEDSIIDFKQSNKPKREEWIEDYYYQGVAYATAHDCIYGTKIEQCVIMMCTPDLYYQQFVLNRSRFRQYKWLWLWRLSEYYKQKM